MRYRPMLILRVLVLALPAAFTAASIAVGQQISRAWVPLQLRRVPVTAADSAQYLTLPVRLQSSAPGVISIRYTVVNSCAAELPIRARERPIRTLELRPDARQRPSRICPGIVDPATYAGTLRGLRAGRWRVVATHLVRQGEEIGDVEIK